jgi:hypothetical protein
MHESSSNLLAQQCNHHIQLEVPIAIKSLGPFTLWKVVADLSLDEEMPQDVIRREL